MLAAMARKEVKSEDLQGFKKLRRVAELLRAVHDVGCDRDKAGKLAAWLDHNVAESLAVFDIPTEHRRRLRTTNLLERINKEIKRRTRVATLFPNEASLLRLASAVLAEIDQEWQSAKVYLTMETNR